MKKNIYIMYAISLLQGMVFYGSIATLYRQANGLSIFQITFIEGISLLLTLLLEFPWGVIADKIGYRNTMLVCNFLYFISKLIFWQADGFFDFMLERVLLAIICSGLSGVDSSILYLSCEKGKSQLVFSIHDNLGMLGLLLAAGIYSMLPGENYSLAGLLTVFTYGIAMILSFGLQEVKASKEHEPFPIQKSFTLLKETLCKPNVLFLVLSIAMITETHHTITVLLNQLQYISVGISSQSISVIYMIVTLSSLLGIFSTFATRHLGKRTFGKLLLLICFTACVILTFTRSAFLSVACILLLNICFSLFQPLQKEQQNETITTRNRATALSIYSVIIDSLSVFITMVLGKVADMNISGAFGFGSLMCLGALILYSMSQPYKR